jgi:hypothetical protein
MTKKLIYTFVTLIIILIVYCQLTKFKPKPILLTQKIISHLTYTVHPDFSKSKNPISKTRILIDHPEIKNLYSILKTAQTTQDHKCASKSTLQLQTSSGNLSFKFLIPHNSDLIEFRHKSQIYQVPSKSLFKSFEQLGLISKSVSNANVITIQ